MVNVIAILGTLEKNKKFRNYDHRKPYLTVMVECRVHPSSFFVLIDRNIIKDWKEEVNPLTRSLRHVPPALHSFPHYRAADKPAWHRHMLYLWGHYEFSYCDWYTCFLLAFWALLLYMSVIWFRNRMFGSVYKKCVNISVFFVSFTADIVSLF